MKTRDAEVVDFSAASAASALLLPPKCIVIFLVAIPPTNAGLAGASAFMMKT